MVMMSQFIHAWSPEPLAVLLESTSFTTGLVNAYLVVMEHYRWRKEIANLYNAFLAFEKRYNRKDTFNIVF